MSRSLRVVVLLALLGACLPWGRPAQAQRGYGYAGDMERFLTWQDAMILSQFRQDFVEDHRYDKLLMAIGKRLNPYLRQVYPHYKDVKWYIFTGRLGFNAQTWHRIIIFDSLLLDAMHNLCDGIAVYGTVDCDWVHNLAAHVVRVNQKCHNGTVHIYPESPENPYHLPTIWGLTPAQRERSNQLFEEMLASWMAHEGSHAFLDHCRERLEAQRERMAKLQAGNGQSAITNQQFEDYVESYMSYELGLQKENEADAYGARLILRAGYTTEGFVDSFLFDQQIEEITGENLQTLRTHPTPADRIATIKRVETEEQKR